MKQYDGIKDEELISRFKNGESEILDYLMEKYKNMVRKKARTMFLIGGENDDLIQEGMIGLFKAVRDYQPDRDAAFQTFASICVDRQIYNAIQSSNRQKHQPLNSYTSIYFYIYVFYPFNIVFFNFYNFVKKHMKSICLHLNVV